MIFLEPLYDYALNHLGHVVNHFALIKLILFALDKTLLYFLLFAIVRLACLLLMHKRKSVGHEVVLWLFVFYIILLFMLTTFRNSYFPWQLVWHWHRDPAEINFVFLKETMKLTHGSSLLDFFYNSFGNVLWFIPFGLLLPLLLRRKKHAGLISFVAGLVVSISIETLQFFLATGVSDVDDVFFNCCGCLLGVFLAKWFFKQRKFTI